MSAVSVASVASVCSVATLPASSLAVNESKRGSAGLEGFPQALATLHALVRASGMSQAQVAKRAEIDPATLSLFLAGRRKLSVEAAVRLCRALGVDTRAVWPAPMAGVSA